MVFQSYALFPHMTVFDNIGYGLRARKDRRVSRAVLTDRVTRMMEIAGLAGLGRRYPRQLSGGQQQRVAVARALVTRPSIVFADEPTGNLDSRSGAELLAFLRRAVTELGQTMVMVTHDPKAALVGDRIIFLRDGRHGGTVEAGDPRARTAIESFVGV